MKKLLFLLGMLVMTFVCPITAHTAKAETADYVADSYLIEISQTESFLPVPNVPNNWTYTITLRSVCGSLSFRNWRSIAACAKCWRSSA